MADYNPNTIAAYQQYGQSMTAGGGGRNMSGLGARTSTASMTTAPSGPVDFTTIDTKTGTQKKVATIDYGSDNDDGPISPTVIYAAAANAATEAGTVFTPTGPKANAMNLYSMPNMVEQVSDYVYRADRNDAITSAIRSTQQEEQDSVDAAIKSINKAITQGKTDAEIAEAFLNDMGGMGNDKPDPNDNFGVPGVTLKDVTGTDEGALSNPQPLYDFAEEMRNPSITVEELPPLTPDQKEKLGAKLREAGTKGDLSSVMNQLAQDSKIQLSSAVSNFIEGAETQVASNDIDPFTGLPFGNNELGFTDVSPSAEAAEQQGLMARPAASSERQDPSYWDRVLFGGDETEAEAAAPAVEAVATTTDSDTIPTEYGTAVFEMGTDLKKVEGTEPHIGEDWENVTLALGIVPTSGLKMDGKTVPSDRAARGRWLKSNGYVSSNGKPTDKFKTANIDTSGAVKDGIKRSDYESDTAWSAAVINNFKEGAQEKVEGFDNLGIAEQKAVIDIAWNMGVGGLDYSGNQSLIGELSKAPEERSIPTMLEAGKHVTEGGKVLRGLARRKALAVNSLISDPNQKIEFIRQTSRGNKTYHTYVNAQGQAVKTLTLGKKHSGSPDGLISVETGEEVTDTQRETSPRPMLRPTE